MPDIQFDASMFPSLEGREEVLWAPVYISPVIGSPERLVAAVAVVGREARYLKRASQLEKLRCLYGGSAELIVAAVESALAELEADLSARGREAVTAPSEAAGILRLGEARRAVVDDYKELALQWLSSISSLHETFELSEGRAFKPAYSRPRGDQLPSTVCEFAANRNSPVIKYFSSSVRRGKRRRSSLTKLDLDFQGPRLVANFSTIRPTANSVRGEFDRMLRRLWELDVTQVRAGHIDSDAVKYELIIQEPNLEEFSGNTDRIRNALEDLKGQADEKKLILRQFNGPQQIVEHLERKEAA